MFTVTPLERDGEMYVEGPPDEVIYSPEIADLFHMLFEDEDFRDPGREARLFSEVDNLNRTLSQIRAATSQPSDVPPISSLERRDTELWEFCRTVAYGDEVDPDAKNYLLERYLKLRDVIIAMRAGGA